MSAHLLEDLHGRLVEGRLDEDGRRHLADLLEDPLQRRAFARLMRIDGLLAEELAAHRGDPAASARVVARPRRGRRRRTPLAWMPMAALAAAVLVLAVGLVAWRRQHAPPPELAPRLPVPVAPMAPDVPGPPPAAVLAWRIQADGSERPWDGTVAGVEQVRWVRWEDGSRFLASAGATWSVLDGGARVRLDSGAFRIGGGHGTSPRFEAPGGRYAVEDGSADLLVQAGATTVQVERGRVRIRDAADRVAASLEPGAAWHVDAMASVAPAPGLGWRAALPQAARMPGLTWEGIPVADGLVMRHDAKTSAEFHCDTWNVAVQAPTTGPAITGFHADARCIVDLTLPGPRLVGVNLQIWAPDGRWLGALERKLDLPAGRNRLDWRLGDLPVILGQGEQLAGGVIRQVAVMAFTADPVVVHGIAIDLLRDTRSASP